MLNQEMNCTMYDEKQKFPYIDFCNWFLEAFINFTTNLYIDRHVELGYVVLDEGVKCVQNEQTSC